MKKVILTLALVSTVAAMAMGKRPAVDPKEIPMNGDKLYAFKVKDIDGAEHALSEYKDKVLLIVNVASKCGNTPQYEGLEKLYKKYKDKGFVVLGFPANEFLGQEPGSNEEIKQFCKLTYGVEFPMFAKIKVKGEGIDPLYLFLTQESAFKGAIGWNFAKFLVARDGRVINRFAPSTKPETPEIVQAIESAL